MTRRAAQTTRAVNASSPSGSRRAEARQTERRKATRAVPGREATHRPAVRRKASRPGGRRRRTSKRGKVRGLAMALIAMATQLMLAVGYGFHLDLPLAIGYTVQTVRSVLALLRPA